MNRMRKFITTFIISAIAFIGLNAQDKEWTLNDCILYAVENSPRVSNLEQQNSIYHQNYLEAIGNLLPKISAGTSAGFNFGRGVDDETNTYINVNSFSNNYSISASLTIFDGLANYTKVRIGRANKMRGKQDLEDVQDMVAYETMQAFFNVLYNNELVKIAEQQLQESEKNLQQVRRMEELGLKGQPDVAEIEAQNASFVYELTTSKTQYTIAIIVLKEKMNFPIEEDLNIAEEDHTSIIAKVAEDPLTIYERSKQYNPKALAAESALKFQKLTYKASKGNLMPSISMNAGISTNFSRYMNGSEYASFKDQFKNKRGEYISFSLSIPIFSGFSRSASVKRAKAQMYMAQNDHDDILRKLYSDIEQAVTDANGQVDQYYQAVKQKEYAEIAHQVNQRKYEEGLVDPIVLHTSANRLLKSKAEEANAKYQYLLKSKLVNYYMGEPFYIEK